MTAASLVVLADDRGTDPFLHHTRALLAAGVPHLQLQVGPTIGSVGPLTLPGRSACGFCLRRHRTDLDPDWPTIAAIITTQPTRAPLSASWTAAAIAAAEALTFLDGDEPPSTVGGTLEWEVGTVDPRRRSWPLHPDCDCRRITRPLLPARPIDTGRAPGEEQ